MTETLKAKRADAPREGQRDLRQADATRSTPALSEIEGLEGEIDHVQRVASRQLYGLT